MIKQNAACLPAAPKRSMSKSEKVFELSAGGGGVPSLRN
jgi:hypothetical protein